MLPSVIILSVSLSIDALFVGLAYGLEGTRIPLRSKLVICLFSILYSALAVFFGTVLARFLPAMAGKIFGALILAGIGLTMILKAVIRSRARKKAAEPENDGILFRFIIRPLNLTVQILKNPDAGDVDRSGIIDTREAVLVGSALSFDALGAGIGSALSGLHGWYIPLTVGLCQLLFLSAGLFAGGNLKGFRNISERYSELIPGIFLLVLSLLRII